MNKKIFIIPAIILLFSVWIFFIKEYRGKAPSFSGKRSHDFGIVFVDKNNPSLEYNFEIENDSSDIRTVARVRTSCKCTTANMAGKRFFPGEKVLVPVQFNIKKSGKKETKAVLEFANGEELVLKLKKNSRWKIPLYFRSSKLLIKPAAQGGRQFLIFESDTQEVPGRVITESDPSLKVLVGDWTRTRVSGNGSPNMWKALVDIRRGEKNPEGLLVRAAIESTEFTAEFLVTTKPPKVITIGPE